MEASWPRIRVIAAFWNIRFVDNTLAAASLPEFLVADPLRTGVLFRTRPPQAMIAGE
jgi:hypothetical protein